MNDETKLLLETARSAWFEAYKACCEKDEKDFDRDACSAAWDESEVKASIYERVNQT